MTNLTPRMMKAAMIQKASKSSHTAPEKAFNDYQKSRKMNLLWDCSYTYDSEWMGYVRLQFDFVGTSGESFKVDYEIDGSKYHSSDRQKRKDNWKDRIKTDHDWKVIHIPAAITHKRFWPYLDAEIAKALASSEMVVYIAG